MRDQHAQARGRAIQPGTPLTIAVDQRVKPVAAGAFDAGGLRIAGGPAQQFAEELAQPSAGVGGKSTSTNIACAALSTSARSGFA